MSQVKNIMSLPVIVASLGYFIDVFDLLLFSAVRTPSLKAIGLEGDALFDAGVLIINAQMAGLILGGLIFGILADKYGRTRMMFVSILTYSLATLGCAFVQDVPMYAALRFIAGIGLAGEFGLALTLVSEILPKHKRGYATAILAGFGMFGAVSAATLAQHISWEMCYIIGGVSGLALLILRARVLESRLFETLPVGISKGDLLMLLRSPNRLMRYGLVILSGGPIIYILWLMATFAPELTVHLGLTEAMSGAVAVMYAYIGFAFGDWASGSLSAFLKTRKRVAIGFWAMSLITCAVYLLMLNTSSYFVFALFYLFMGFFAGYWVVICVMALEMFGTNLRATVASSVPNFIRASFIPMGLGVSVLKPELGLIDAALVIGGVVFALSLIALMLLPETHNNDLEFEES